MNAPVAARSLSAECLGTAALLAVVVGSGIMGERLAGELANSAAIALLANSLATVGGLFVLIWLFAPLSGAHFNPLVSAAERAAGRQCTRLTAAYWLVQVLGAIAGVLIAHAMFDLPLLQASTKVRTGAAQWIAEGVASFGLLLVIGLSAKETAATVAARVACYIGAAYWFTASTSFANPAVTLARAFTDTFAGIRLIDVPMFVVAQCVGAAGGSWVARWFNRQSIGK
ncbi:MAG: aquaporin [Betaproteobacteria bacterium]|nr:aquaporin [Betaproteobacteria bacterium]